jgi:hypothetical protein
MEDPVFTPDRMDGVTIGKTVPLNADASDVAIVLDAACWHNVDEPATHLVMFSTVAHEFVHAIIDRARSASGARGTEPWPPVTGHEQAREMARSIADEYRCERVAGIYSALTGTVEIDGVRHPAATWYVNGSGRMSALSAVLSAAHPRWPDIVQSYREREIDLVQMFRQVASSVAETVMAIARAQAEADASEEQADVLSDPTLCDLPATQLYIAEPWMAFCQVLRAQPLLPSLAAFPEIERQIVLAGESALVEIWGRLGWTILDHPDRRWGLLVGEPLR